MAEMSLDDFSGSLGEPFEVEAGGAAFTLTLEKAEEIPGSQRPGGGFRLLFLGPREPVLPQAIYNVRRGDTASDIFLVPVGQDAAATRYEAIFN